MDKVFWWKRKIEDYYNHKSMKQLKEDLELAGFKVNRINEDFSVNSLNIQLEKIAATLDDNFSLTDKQSLDKHKMNVK